MACSMRGQCRRAGDTLSVGTPLPGRNYQTTPDVSVATSSRIARRGLGGHGKGKVTQAPAMPRDSPPHLPWGHGTVRVGAAPGFHQPLCWATAVWSGDAVPTTRVTCQPPAPRPAAASVPSAVTPICRETPLHHACPAAHSDPAAIMAGASPMLGQLLLWDAQAARHTEGPLHCMASSQALPPSHEGFQ